ncbi:ATP-sensitive inward rectifier potassium channel 1 [Eurytemora carolleeae]|uniref:ATP-sensitive inward rectifier potassium channel 1 n=1 Tax=Eurytemora carolleeae TaxID=1294199 RepID=UPI000C78B777|nr:ATP-sensitive inward rectifier potassium channel 1 [Eurytemora carolleeae]|eukprot:XP_023324434.1 ATP-sensitive inward rectifier potassium channel 1-like [Eurytemora affinis]
MSSRSFYGAPKKRKRLILKNGEIDTETRTLTWWNPFNFDNAMTYNWVTIVLLYIIVFLVSWFIFAVLYYTLDNTDRVEGKEKSLCLDNVKTFAEALLFSIETQQTIGYGTRAVTDKCLVASMVVTVHSLFGMVLSSIMTGLLLNKFTQTSSKHWGVFFSKKALIMLRGKSLYLAIRVADVQETKLRDAEIEALFFSAVETQEGEVLNEQPTSFQFGFQMDGTNARIPLLWPTILVHKIDVFSPLYRLNKDGLEKAEFEIVVWLTGNSSDNGAFIQIRTSYTPEDIVWGAKFSHKPVVEYETHLSAVYSEETISKYTETDLPNLSAENMEKQGLIQEPQIDSALDLA